MDGLPRKVPPTTSLTILGWRELVGLPDLGIRTIKAKVDTGARSSSLHAYDIEEFDKDGELWVRFNIRPIQHDDTKVVRASARILDRRHVRSSSGQVTERYVISTTVKLMGESWPIELTLACRDEMGFRMLLGREAIRGKFYVDPNSSYHGGGKERPSKRKQQES